MDNNTTIVCIFALIILSVFIFGGEPDLKDALVAKLTEQKPKDEAGHE